MNLSNENPVTIRMVAETACVSVGTVSKVLNSGNCKPETAARVHAAIRSLGYHPNPYAQAVRSMRTRCLGILVDAGCKQNNLWINDLLLALIESVSCRKYQTHVQFIDMEGEDVGDFNGLPQRVDGIVLVGAFNRKFHAACEENFTVPAACYWEALPLSRALLVEVDVHGAFQQMLEHLVALGHRRIVALSGTSTTDQKKMERLRTVAAHFAATCSVEILSSDSVDDTSRHGFDLTGTALKRFPDVSALFYAADALALGGLAQLAKLRLRVPEDLSVVSFDNTTWAKNEIPALTSIGFDFRELADELVRRLIETIENRGPVLRPRPIELHFERRDSTALRRTMRELKL